MSSEEFIIVNDKYDCDYKFPFEDFIPEIEKLKERQFFRELFLYKLLRGNYGKDLRDSYGLDECMNQFEVRSPFTHLCNAIQLGLPEGMVQFTSRGYINDYLLMGLQALCSEDDISFAGSASTGKTFACSLFIPFDWAAAPECTTTLIGSTSIVALDDRIWGDTTKIYRAMKYRVGELVEYKRSIVFGKKETDDSEREYRNAIKAIAIEKGRDGQNVVDSTRGRKNLRFRVFLDEFAEMDMYVANLRVNLLSNDDLMFVAIANPLLGRNPHFELSLPKGHTKFPPEHRTWKSWRTRTGVCVFFNGENSPNMKAPENEPPPFPTLMTRRKLDKMLIACHGNKNSLEYWRNAVGGWPPSDIQTSILSEEMLRASNTQDQPVWMANPPIVKLAALDPAFTAGGDKIPLTIGKLGKNRMSKTVAYIEKTINITPDASGDFITNLAEEVVDTLIREGVEPENFGLDVSNDGGKVAQAIMRYWLETNENAMNIYLISSNDGCSERLISEVDKRKCCDVYDRKVTELWFAVNTAVINRCIFGLDPLGDAAEQFYSRQIIAKGRKQSVVTKAEMKKLIGRSPDDADSVAYFVEMAIRAGLVMIPDEDVLDIIEALENNRPYESKSDEQEEYGNYESDDWGED